MNTEPFAERLPQTFLNLYCTQLAAWWGGSRNPLRVKLAWPANLGRAEVEHATIMVEAGEVNGERRLCIVPASDEDDKIIGRNVIAWLDDREFVDRMPYPKPPQLDPEFIAKSTPTREWLEQHAPGILAQVDGGPIEMLSPGPAPLPGAYGKLVDELPQRIADAIYGGGDGTE